MFDLHKDLNEFFEEHVRLGKKRRDWLAGVRNTNLERLKSGLDSLGDKRGILYPHFQETRDQGGYAMRTLNQHAENAYDIDNALIFRDADVPQEAAAARQRICDALKEKPGNFLRPPKARTNAVTVWYADGPHVDFAVYRQRQDIWGRSIIEHASGDKWIARDPDAVTDWFEKRVESLSPASLLIFEGAAKAEQLRRIVRLVKFFCRSRVDWDLPGGMITTALVVECYRLSAKRDDIALYETMVALWYRLSTDLKVRSPVDWTQELTAKSEYVDQVGRFRDQLAWALGKLAILHDKTCTAAQARDSWRQVFNHEFWSASAAANANGLLRIATTVTAMRFPNRPTSPVKAAGFA
jgi:hypothetical protein